MEKTVGSEIFKLSPTLGVEKKIGGLPYIRRPGTKVFGLGTFEVLKFFNFRCLEFYNLNFKVKNFCTFEVLRF